MLEIAADPTIDGGRSGGDRIIALDPAERPTGVVCGNDQSCSPLAAADLRVPGDVALIGYDDIAYAAAGTTPLTTIRQPRDEMGQAAVRLLLDEIADADTHHHRSIVFPPKLIIRRSA